MHRRVILMRHATASNAPHHHSDLDRPLTSSGIDDAREMVQQLQHHGWVPTIAHHSHARRTTQTAAAFADLHVPRRAYQSLYLRGLPAIVDLAQTWPSHEAGPILLVGHNPGWAEAASALACQSIMLSPGDAVLISTDAVTWTAAFQSRWHLHAILRPTNSRAMA